MKEEIDHEYRDLVKAIYIWKKNTHDCKNKQQKGQINPNQQPKPKQNPIADNLKQRTNKSHSQTPKSTPPENPKQTKNPQTKQIKPEKLPGFRSSCEASLVFEWSTRFVLKRK